MATWQMSEPLLNATANLSTNETKQGRLPCTAAFGGHRDVVQALVEQGAEINAGDGQFGATPAGWAIE